MSDPILYIVVLVGLFSAFGIIATVLAYVLWKTAEFDELNPLSENDGIPEKAPDNVCRFCGTDVPDPLETKYGHFCGEYHADLYATHNKLGMRVIRKLGLEHI